MPKPIRLTVTPQEVNLIGAALGRLPHDDVRPLIEKLAAQVQAQLKPETK